MYRRCCVPKCNSLRKDVKFRQFPSNELMKRKWFKCLNSENLDFNRPKLYVCNKHFEKKFFTEKNRLNTKAYPSLFTDLEISSGNPSVPLETENTDRSPICDHNYYRRKRHIDHSYSKTTDHCGKKEDGPIKAASSEHIATLPLTDPLAHQICTDAAPIPMHIELDTLPLTDPLAHQICTDAAPTPIHIELATVVAHQTGSNGSLTTSMPMQIEAGLICSPQRSTKKRVIQNVKSLTPMCQLLYEEYKKARRQKDYMARAKRAMKFSKEASFEKLTKKMSPLSKRFMWMQIKLSSKAKKGRRFSMEEKLIALSIYKLGPKSYRNLRRIFILPSKNTLKKMISKLDIDTSITPQNVDLINKTSGEELG